MMQIEIIKTKARIPIEEFYAKHPTTYFPSLDPTVLEPFGVRLIENPDRVPVYPRFEGNAKLDLFTPEEQLRIVEFTMTNGVVKLLYDRLIAAKYWTYEDAETEVGLSKLVEFGLLTQERKEQIVSNMMPVN